MFAGGVQIPPVGRIDTPRDAKTAKTPKATLAARLDGGGRRLCYGLDHRPHRLWKFFDWEAFSSAKVT